MKRREEFQREQIPRTRGRQEKLRRGHFSRKVVNYKIIKEGDVIGSDRGGDRGRCFK